MPHRFPPGDDDDRRRGRAARLAGVGAPADEIAAETGISLADARRLIAERDHRIRDGMETWADRGEHPPPRRGAKSGKRRGRGR